MDKPSLDDREAWSQHPVTKFILSGMKTKIEHYQRAWAEGNLTTESSDGTIQRNSEAIGHVQELMELTDDFLNVAKEDQDA